MSTVPPYITSGSTSRAHHSLVVKLEAAASENERQVILTSELDRCRILFTSSPSNSKVSETLIVILQCAMLRQSTDDKLEWALIKALDLAETGQTLAERRMGYMFLSEIMPKGHELELMLVNTIRKDLASKQAQQVLLGLTMVIQFPSAELAPAVSPLLTSKDLLKHKNSAVRKRTFLALGALYPNPPPSTHKGKAKATDPLTPSCSFPLSMGKVAKLLSTETDSSNQIVLVRIIRDMLKHGAHSIASEEEISYLVELVLEKSEQAQGVGKFENVRTLGSLLSRSDQGLEIPFTWLRGELQNSRLTSRSDMAFILEACALQVVKTSPDIIPILLRHIKAALLLSSTTGTSSSNMHVFALRCLTQLPKESWDGQLDENEMGIIMQGLEHVDDTIRKLTLRLLLDLDPTLLDLTFDGLLKQLETHDLPNLRTRKSSNLHSDPDHTGKGTLATRALEVAEVMCGIGTREAEVEPSGAQYVQTVSKILVAYHEDGPEHPWEEGIRRILEMLRDGSESFATSFTAIIVAPEATNDSGATLAVVRATVICEYARQPLSDGKQILSTLLKDLKASPGSVQEVILVALVAIVYRMPANPRHEGIEEIISVLQDLRAGSSKHVSKRCGQVMTVFQTEGALDQVYRSTKSHSPPDLLVAIVETASSLSRSPQTSPMTYTPVQLTASRSPASKLRYDPYDAPSLSPPFSPHAPLSRTSVPRAADLPRNGSSIRESYALMDEQEQEEVSQQLIPQER
ncbi:hypothetical protein TREMEDRAFT_74073 [Tremella mesenterica DSM 1558]|uniref:uncharacterized protein n=1 Tax=Tremella mesenterica (strain ATCC 24925 / CBS 8224 / DSM 1558 / NBRC 9311 / NRRL Y-6157 / RJB 2259-6 / UBC 559-6) TaxID=578456 RepID=UPI0003F49F1E|nr:uncharacterized protein TREMEDRAFT_74073 [Tremella mesenterica DSM 1558]EIW68510.1 hypothetical protein TREMEDRAFT_74073 [Tremella mesenterica DSM 1558]